jgi:hypothetical protein
VLHGRSGDDKSEHDIDEASYHEHENRYHRENPKDADPSSFIGVIAIASEEGIQTFHNENATLCSANGHPRM